MGTILISIKDAGGNIISESKITKEDSEILSAIDAFASADKYQDVLEDGSENPESKADCMVRRILEIMADKINTHIVQSAEAAARVAAQANKVSF